MKKIIDYLPDSVRLGLLIALMMISSVVIYGAFILDTVIEKTRSEHHGKGTRQEQKDQSREA